MINAIYSLIRNADGRGAPTTDDEEYTPLDYRAVELPAELRAVRDVLFGRDPDHRAVCYRLRQYMACVHATELHEHVLAYFDPRITYLPLPDGPSFASTVEVTPIGHDNRLYLGGELPREDGAGRASYRWLVEAVEP